MKRTILFVLFMSVACMASEAQDWAQYARYAQQNDSLRAAGIRPRIVFMGNSITDFWGQWRPDFFTSNAAVCRGISGQTTQQMLSRFQADVVALQPQYVIILAGVNDIAQNNGPITLPHIVENIRSMCELARINGITPILCTPLPCKRFFWRPDMHPEADIRTLKDMIGQYAAQADILYVNYYSAMDDGEGGLLPHLTDDGCHPTIAGYEVMEKVLQPIIDTLP